MVESILIEKYFGFLKSKYGFEGPFTYNLARESHIDFVKDNIVIRICYEGSYWVDLVKVKKVIKEYKTSEFRITNLDFKLSRHYILGKLDYKQKLWNSVSLDNFPDKPLWYYSKLILMNREILDGDLRKFSIWYHFKRLIGMINK